MVISEIYEKYHIPKNLQKHMLMVASVGKYIIKNKPSLDEHLIIVTLLLHDMGNLVKYNLETGLSLFPEDRERLEYWRLIQRQLIKKYEGNEHVATLEIVKEVCGRKNIEGLIKHINSDDISKVLSSTDFNVKVCVYCDFRATDTKFVSIKKRFADIIKRYQDRNNFFGKNKILEKRSLCLQLEKQIEDKFNMSLKRFPLTKMVKIQNDLLRFNLD